jgi:hypothetical protein
VDLDQGALGGLVGQIVVVEIAETVLYQGRATGLGELVEGFRVSLDRSFYEGWVEEREVDRSHVEDNSGSAHGDSPAKCGKAV